MKTKVTSTFDLYNLNYVKLLAKLENRKVSSLVNEMIREHYQKIAFKKKNENF